MLPAYDNLLSDASVGYIDRHNYFGGGLDDSMMGDPGGGYLATGLQRVQGLPFGISEWITGYPSLYSAEGPALFAAYGMGLQDWNASYEFQSSSSHVDWANEVGHPPWGVWNADIPSQVGQAVTLARMIYRGDVTPGKIISVRHVTPKDLAAGDFDFSDDIQQQGDVKTFGGSCPPAALAVGRCLVDFSPTPAPSIFPKLEDFRTGTVLHSTTGQLAWDSAGRGCVSIDTPGTTGVIGFAPDRTFTLCLAHADRGTAQSDPGRRIHRADLGLRPQQQPRLHLVHPAAAHHRQWRWRSPDGAGQGPHPHRRAHHHRGQCPRPRRRTHRHHHPGDRRNLHHRRGQGPRLLL